jgi:hypothetical protein
LWANYSSFLKMLLVFAACANEDISVKWVGGIHATGHAVFGAQSAYAHLHIDLEVVHAEPADGCSGITNGDALAGKIALIQRGACAFVEKVLNAQNMGAAAVIIYNDQDGNINTMRGDDDGHNILAVSISENDGNALAAAVAIGTTTVSLSCQVCDTGRNDRFTFCTAPAPMASTGRCTTCTLGECGCADPIAVNYDPNAVHMVASCAYDCATNNTNVSCKRLGPNLQ